jgi:hypothetical protein
MAIHILLLAVNEVNPNLEREVQIFPDCLGALNKVKNLPPARVPCNVMHSNILKNIPVNCSNISFDRYYSHIHSHQNNKEEYKYLSRPLQLNCSMDFLTKQTLWELQLTLLPTQKAFPLKPVCIFCRRHQNNS